MRTYTKLDIKLNQGALEKIDLTLTGCNSTMEDLVVRVHKNWKFLNQQIRFDNNQLGQLIILKLQFDCL